jgi:hypothetical protein
MGADSSVTFGVLSITVCIVYISFSTKELIQLFSIQRWCFIVTANLCMASMNNFIIV